MLRLRVHSASTRKAHFIDRLLRYVTEDNCSGLGASELLFVLLMRFSGVRWQSTDYSEGGSLIFLPRLSGGVSATVKWPFSLDLAKSSTLYRCWLEESGKADLEALPFIADEEMRT